jgi:hypothetical protein
MVTPEVYSLYLDTDEISQLHGFLDHIIDIMQDSAEVPAEIHQVFAKVTVLYEDYCAEYTLTPVAKAFSQVYAHDDWAIKAATNHPDWVNFRKHYDMMVEFGFITEES